jgi:hypothetical protein
MLYFGGLLAAAFTKEERKHSRAFLAHGIQRSWIQSECSDD